MLKIQNGMQSARAKKARNQFDVENALTVFLVHTDKSYSKMLEKLRRSKRFGLNVHQRRPFINTDKMLHPLVTLHGQA